jgi:signal peptidase II
MLALIIGIVLVVTDQLTKLLVLSSLKPIGKVELIKGFFNLTYIENRGAAFGMLEGGKWLFLAITAVVLVLAVVYYLKAPKTPQTLPVKIAVVMICSGAVGNAIDRLFRSYVVDFLDFIIFGYDFPVFNFADILVVLGTILFAGSILLFDGKEENNNKETD